jgi:hypothetical protein
MRKIDPKAEEERMSPNQCTQGTVLKFHGIVSSLATLAQFVP